MHEPLSVLRRENGLVRTQLRESEEASVMSTVLSSVEGGRGKEEEEELPTVGDRQVPVEGHVQMGSQVKVNTQRDASDCRQCEYCGVFVRRQLSDDGQSERDCSRY